MQGIIIGLHNPNLFFYLTNRVKKHENIATPLAESVRLSVFSESPLIILFTLDVYASRKKHPFLYSEFANQSMIKSTLNDIFRKSSGLGKMLRGLLFIESGNQNSECIYEQFNQDRFNHCSHFGFMRGVFVSLDCWWRCDLFQQCHFKPNAHRSDTLQPDRSHAYSIR